jgi:hypothetical protein
MRQKPQSRRLRTAYSHPATDKTSNCSQVQDGVAIGDDTDSTFLSADILRGNNASESVTGLRKLRECNPRACLLVRREAGEGRVWTLLCAVIDQARQYRLGGWLGMHRAVGYAGDKETTTKSTGDGELDACASCSTERLNSGVRTRPISSALRT